MGIFNLGFKVGNSSKVRKKRILWSSFDYSSDDVYNLVHKMHPELGYTEVGQFIESKIYERYEYIYGKLNIPLANKIIVICNIQVYNDDNVKYKICENRNLRVILEHFEERFELYTDKNDVRAYGIGLDGSIHKYTYRLINPGIDINKFCKLINYGGKINRNTLDKYTMSLLGIMDRLRIDDNKNIYIKK